MGPPAVRGRVRRGGPPVGMSTKPHGTDASGVMSAR